MDDYSSGSARIVLPGEVVAGQPMAIPGCYVSGGKTVASVISLMRDGKMIPLKGTYLPTPDDYVVGIVVEERFSGYSVELHSPYLGNLSSRETRYQFKAGNLISAKIAEVNEVNEAILMDERPLGVGSIIEVDYVKVPRIIGRNGSMLEMIRQYTGTDVFVGKNGRIFVRGGDALLAGKAILKIDVEAHVPGLTDRIQQFLEKESGKKF